MIMSIAWLYGQGLYQCLSPGCVTTNIVVTFFLAVRLLIIWLPDSFQSENFVILSLSRGWADSDQLILCLPVAWPMTSDHVVICSPAVWPKLSFYLMSPLAGRPVIILITCLSFRLSIDNFTIAAVRQVIIGSQVCWLYAQSRFFLSYDSRVNTWSPMTWCWPEAAPFYTV